MPFKEYTRDRLRQFFDTVTLRLEKDHQDGLRILAKQALRHRFLMGGIIITNLCAALFEGGTIGILGVAVSVLVENETANLFGRFGSLGPHLASLTLEVGRGGLFLILVIAAVAAQVLKSGLSYLAGLFSIKLRFRVNAELQEMVVNQVMSLSYAEVGRYPAGTVNALVGQAMGISQLINVFSQVTLTLLMFVVYVAVMIAMSVPLTLSAIAVIAVLGFSLNRVVGTLKVLGEKMASATITTGKLTFEYLQAPRLLRIFNATGLAEKSIRSTRMEMLNAREKSASIRAGIDPATDALTVAGAGTFLVVGYVVAGESATSVIPNLLLFVFVLNRMMPQVKAFNQARMSFFNTLPTVKRVASFLRTEDKAYARKGGVPFSGLKSEVRFENVDFRYPNTDINALTDISFAVPKGTTVALVGASGAGKSTLADLILGLHDPGGGRILVDGMDLREIDLDCWRGNIGVVDQEVFLLNANIFDNITFANDGYSMKDVELAARAAYAHEFISRLPDGYETEVGDRAYRLSGGQQQRLALARALLRNPQLLVLDEATSALDTESERIIQNTLETLHHERTMLVIAHRLSTLVRADRIVVLRQGRIAEQGTWGELMNESGLFAELWNMQIGASAAG